jgi:hypothetical protein
MAPEWLAAADRAWVDQNRDLLEAIWKDFEKSGQWPDPVEIKRQLRAQHPNRRVGAALDEIPRVLGQQEFAPRRITLSLFGIGCCTSAQPLMDQYVAVARLALKRFDVPGLPNRLNRGDIVAELGLDDRQADRLSAVLMRDAPFLASGQSDIERWDREIDPRVEEFEGLEDAPALMAFLASQRRIAVEPQPPAAIEEIPAADSAPVLPLLAALAGIGSFLIAAATVSLLLGIILIAIFLGLSLALLIGRRAPLLAAATVIALPAVAATFGLLFATEGGSGGPYRYFVASTGRADALVARIEPRAAAPMQRGTVLVSGDPVAVECLLSGEERDWAKLVNGSFVPAALLTVEVGGDRAPACG